MEIGARRPISAQKETCGVIRLTSFTSMFPHPPRSRGGPEAPTGS
jgi:hypothetical protein